MFNRIIFFNLLIFLLVSFTTVYAQDIEQQTIYKPKMSLEIPVIKSFDLPTPPGFDEKSISPITAKEASAIALLNQPKIAVAKSQLFEAKGKAKSVSSSNNPSLMAGASYTAQSRPYGNNPSGQNADSSSLYSMDASLRKLIFDFNHTRSLIISALAKESASFQNLTKVQADVVLDVKRSFYKHLQNEKLTELYELNLENQKEHLNMARERYRAGVGLPFDVVRAQAAVAEAVFNLTQANAEFSLSRLNLAISMGIDPRVPLETVALQEDEVEISNLESLYDQALTIRPEILSAQFELESAKKELDAMRSGNAPVISAQANWNSRDRRLLPDYGYFTMGVYADFTLYDGGLNAGKIEQAQAVEMACQAKYELARQEVVRDVSSAYLLLQNAKQALSMSIIESESAIEAHRLANGRYKAGVGILLDVLDSQNAMLKAEMNVISANSLLNQARAELKWAIGTGL